MVIAGPGSGKTAVLTTRLARLTQVHHIPASRILVITFTRDAAKEMSDRFHKIAPREEKPWIRTFHAAFFEILRKESSFPYVLLEEKEAIEAISDWLREEFKCTLEEAKWKAELIFHQYSRLRNTGGLEEEKLKHLEENNNGLEVFRGAIGHYEEYKAFHEKIDFDDMMMKLKALFIERPEVLASYQERFQYILVDEFQDINSVQYELLIRLAARYRNLFVVGDDDQSIYGFRGSSPRFLLRFSKDFPETKRVDLTVNFRCADAIIRASSELIRHNRIRFLKDLKGSGSGKRGSCILEAHTTSEGQASWISREIRKQEGSCAVLCRTKKEFKDITKALADHGIFYLCQELEGIASQIEQIMRSYILWALDKGSKEDIEIVYKASGMNMAPDLAGSRDPDRVIKQREMEHVRNKIRHMDPLHAIRYIWCMGGVREYMMRQQEKEGMRWSDVTRQFKVLKEEACLFQNLQNWIQRKSDPGLPKVRVMTMHGAKGLEFDAVFIPNLNEGFCPHERSTGEDAIEEERRVLYVAMTRPRKRLYLSYIKEQASKRKPSRFLDDFSI